ERARGERLRETGVVLEQHVAVAEDREEDDLERVALADDGALDLVEDACRSLAQLGELHHSRSTASTRAEMRRSGRPGALRSGGTGRSRRSSHASSPRISRAWTRSLWRSARRAAATSRSCGSRRACSSPALEVVR